MSAVLTVFAFCQGPCHWWDDDYDAKYAGEKGAASLHTICYALSVTPNLVTTYIRT